MRSIFDKDERESISADSSTESIYTDTRDSQDSQSDTYSDGENRFLNFMAKEKQPMSQGERVVLDEEEEAPEAPPDPDDDGNGNDTDDSKNADDDGQKRSKKDNEFVEGFGEFIAEVNDVLMPKIIQWANEDNNDYSASAREKALLIEAWESYLAEKDVELTPLQKIMAVNAVSYGMPLFVGLVAKVPKLWEKFQEWLKKKTRDSKKQKTEEWEEAKADAKQPEEEYSVDENDYPGKPKMPDVDEKTDSNEKKKEESQAVVKATADKIDRKCKYRKCFNRFEVGHGYPKGGRRENLKDGFCSSSCYVRFCNENRIFGKGSRHKPKFTR